MKNNSYLCGKFAYIKYMGSVLFADSGSTKTKWMLRGESDSFLETEGINPMHQDFAQIEKVLDELEKWLVEVPAKVCFYGAGCAEMASCDSLAGQLRRHTHCDVVTVESDIVGAARFLFGDSRGVACILGTGSNSVLWDGAKVVMNVHAGGFILGDEGSGAVFGRRLLSDFVKGLTPEPLDSILRDRYGLDYFNIIERVYRQTLPNRYLASYTRLLGEHRDLPYVHAMLLDEFERFFTRNVMQYPDAKSLPVGFVGSVAYHFEAELCEAACRLGMNVTRIMKTPF